MTHPPAALGQAQEVLEQVRAASTEASIAAAAAGDTRLAAALASVHKHAADVPASRRHLEKLYREVATGSAAAVQQAICKGGAIHGYILAAQKLELLLRELHFKEIEQQLAQLIRSDSEATSQAGGALPALAASPNGTPPSPKAATRKPAPSPRLMQASRPSPLSSLPLLSA